MTIDSENNVELTSETISSWCPFIATPCYDRQVTEPYFLSMINSTVFFNEIEMDFGISTLSDSLISRARNNLVAKFLANSEFTHLMFIDADIGFAPEDVLRLLWHDKDVVAGPYAIKNIDWPKVHDNVHKGVENDLLLSKSLKYVGNIVEPGGDFYWPPGDGMDESGIFKTYEVGSGFLLIKRSVFERLIDAYPGLAYDDDTNTLEGEERNWSYCFFHDFIDSENKRLLSEDYGFCKLWRDAGGEIYADPLLGLGHLGRFMFTGSLYDHLESVYFETD